MTTEQPERWYTQDGWEVVEAAEYDALAKRERALVEALRRLLRNAEHIFDKQPVRDWDETLHEARAALSSTEGAGDG